MKKTTSNNYLTTEREKIKKDILFIIPPFHLRNGSGSFFPLGIGYIISELNKSDYSWESINCSKIVKTLFPKDLEQLSSWLIKVLSKYKPLVIGIGPCITTQVRALKVIAEVCHVVFPGIPLFAGGPLASIKNQEWLFYEELGINYLIKGDGEKAVTDAIRKVKESGDIANSTYVSHVGYSHVNFIKDINDLEFPYREFINDKFSIRRADSSNLQAAMITSRGCPYACNYCVSGNLELSYRKRDIKNILDEMQMLQQKYGVTDIVFYDDCFFYNKKNVNNDIIIFCSALQQRKLKLSWQIEMRPDVFCQLSDNNIKLLQSTGCRQINLGIEKTTVVGLDFLGKCNYLPDVEAKIKQVKTISKISISATFILGGKNETVDDILNLINESTKLQLDFAHYNPLFVYPGTPIYDSVFQTNKEWVDYILNDDLPWGEIVYETQFVSREKLLQLVDHAYSEFYKDTHLADQPMVKDRFNLREKQK